MSKISVLFSFTIIAVWVFANYSESKLDVGIYELKRGDFSLKLTNWGATIVSLVLPDKYGKLADVVLGYDSIKDYMNDTTYFGATVGRVANRIGGAQFTLNGTHYKLVANEGKNMLHGGAIGFSDVVWKVKNYHDEGHSPYITFSYHSFDGEEGKWKSYRLIDYRDKRGQFRTNSNSCVALCASSSSSMSVSKKLVWIWTQNKHVMTAAVERGWNTFVFPSHCRDLANEWSSMALIHPLFIEKGELLDSEHKRVATFSEISSPDQLEQLQPGDEQAESIIVNLLDWQVIPAENIVAAFQSSQKTVFSISRTTAEAQIFLEALELGLGGVVLKVEDVKAVLELKVGSFARGLFLVHSECLESNYISSRPFRVNAGPVHAYVAVPGGKTSYLSELNAGKEVIVVDQSGRQRTAVVGRVKIETRPLILVEAKRDLDNHTAYGILLQNAETVALICSQRENGNQTTAIPVTSLKVGDEVLLRIQGGARHTGIEIQEFIVEK